MSRKTFCPGCESYTSSLYEAYENGWPCEVCGLSNAAWREILLIQAARNDDELSKRFTELRKENDELKRKLEEVNNKMARLRADVKKTLGGLSDV